jgi:hypothetical protein
MDIKKTHTSDLVKNFYGQLLQRRAHLNDIDEDMLEDWQVQIINEEIERINNIMKLINKGKL